MREIAEERQIAGFEGGLKALQEEAAEKTR